MNYDVIIIGAGPAGLTAATYLARFRRSVLVCDGGPPRALWIPESHNTPGFPDGVDGPSLVQRMRKQATKFGAVLRVGLVEEVRIQKDGFTARCDNEEISARCILLATGVVDKLPDVPGIEAAIRASRVRLCPICDAFEAIDSRLAVLAAGDGRARA